MLAFRPCRLSVPRLCATTGCDRRPRRIERRVGRRREPDRGRVRHWREPMTNVVIAAAARTPVGSFNGAFANIPAHELGASTIKAALERAGVAADEVSETILGQVLTAGQGQNPAR